VAASREAKDILKKELGAAYDSVKVIELDQLGANASTTASVPTPFHPSILRAQTHVLFVGGGVVRFNEKSTIL
jgi:hypothetical protein